jgi:membrane fusion protein, heavy metal efflux system
VTRTMPNPFIALLSILLAVGCGDDHDHDHDGTGGHGGGDHGDHDHGGADDGPPAQVVTAWTDASELFMEYDAFVVGHESRFLAHVSILDGFQPVREGSATVTVAMKGGGAERLTVDSPTRPGIFIPVFTPKQAGDCSLVVEIKSPSLVDRIDAGPCTIYPDEATAKAALGGEEDDGGTISFLKEQQWVIDFATAEVVSRELQPGVRVNAEILAVPDREARLTAPTDGRIAFATPVPILGATVKKGQLLATIQPTVSASGNHGSLEADVDAATAQLTAATAQRDRLARLVADDAVPRRRLENAEAEVKVARARLDAARTRLQSYNASAQGGTATTSGAFRVRAPIDGTLVDVRVTSGETIQGGALLFTIIDLDRVWVTGRVFEADLPKLDDTSTAWFQVEGRDDVFEIGGDHGKLVTVGSVIDPRTRTVPVVFEVSNETRVLRIGQFATLTIATGKPITAVAVPETALLQDGGQWVAHVQSEGESFERRIVQTGVKSRGWVEVRGGLSAGERVVTTGAYDVKLAASAGSAPAHGHSH